MDQVRTILVPDMTHETDVEASSKPGPSGKSRGRGARGGCRAIDPMRRGPAKPPRTMAESQMSDVRRLTPTSPPSITDSCAL